MRRRVMVAITALLAIGTSAPTLGLAQGSPSTEQIIKSLIPTSPSGATRGIHVGPVAPTQSQAPAARPAISLTVLFKTGSAELTPQALEVLNNLGKALSDKALDGYRFRIEGHTDTVGTREYNRQLSARRAAAVVDYLAANFHIDRSRVEAVGMGEDGLLIPTPDQTPEPRNRRVEVINVGT